MAGLASDGGLFVPASLPDAAPLLESWKALPFASLFTEIVALFVGDDLARDELEALVARSFGRFDHPEITPVVKVGGLYLVELFHGPTLAFKDVALQFLGNLFEHFLRRRETHLTVVGATSGDTGSAAIQALRGKQGVEVFILFPRGRVSPIQELQMTTVADPNIHAVAVEGSFDDAQSIVKGLFNDHRFNGEHRLGAVNSINWARVMAQLVYYFFSYFRVVESRGGRLGEPVRFSVPTGNFGNIFAGVLAKRMGLPVERLILATNANDILHRFVAGGSYRKGQVTATISPSMDIQVASNFERYLFHLAGSDGAQVEGWMEQLREQGGFAVSPEQLRQVHADFLSARVDDEATLETIRTFHEKEGYLLDPHSAVGVAAALERGEGWPVICMGTAHPGKFPTAIARAIAAPPPPPPALEGLADLPTRLRVLPATTGAVRGYIEETLAAVPAPAPH